MSSSSQVGTQTPAVHVEHAILERHGNESPSSTAERTGNQRPERTQGTRRGGYPGRGGRGGTHGRQSRRPPNSRPPGLGSKGNHNARLNGDVSKQQMDENHAAGVTSTHNEQEETEDRIEQEVCFICASPIVHHAVTPCNHRTCHICALRLRALYKTNACAHCRVSLLHTQWSTRKY